MTITQSMLRDCIRREVRGAIPEKKKRNLARHQRPLFAWLQGAPKYKEKSPIECVKDNQTRWPWYTLNACGDEFVRRITKRKNLTFIQRQWIYDYISLRYQGKYELRRYWIDDVHYGFKDEHKIISNSIYEFIQKCLDKEGVTHPPLRLILSKELSVLIELKTLEKLV